MLELARAYTSYGDVLYGDGLYAAAADWYRRADAMRQDAAGPHVDGRVLASGTEPRDRAR